MKSSPFADYIQSCKMSRHSALHVRAISQHQYCYNLPLIQAHRSQHLSEPLDIHFSQYHPPRIHASSHWFGRSKPRQWQIGAQLGTTLSACKWHCLGIRGLLHAIRLGLPCKVIKAYYECSSSHIQSIRNQAGAFGHQHGLIVMLVSYHLFTPQFVSISRVLLSHGVWSYSAIRLRSERLSMA